ncbi:AzlD domain-containing protein [Pseudoduganella umbonata]|uniref:AzlD domain-containing protein n=1 Tax=Pseudoduganella umbonata TaxID=864828 RepID=A0A4P8HTI3_9BURK|nr:AzlD domain-containing protein [Pseudoduganella umbonata]MBB3220468.1 branched-subunit amino acid transport protein [Pseudoduganella umbonata]QCP12008.1 AzlD domain-containing protein [Pseudoduganella umbonata]
MSDLEIWIVIVSLAIATALTRSGFWLVGHKVTIPPRVQEMLRYAPSCALAAIIAPDLLLDGAGVVHLDLGNARLIAGIASVAWFAWRRRMLETIVFGMLFFTALRLLHLYQ